jgi:hypothetical protein
MAYYVAPDNRILDVPFIHEEAFLKRYPLARMLTNEEFDQQKRYNEQKRFEVALAATQAVTDNTVAPTLTSTATLDAGETPAASYPMLSDGQPPLSPPYNQPPVATPTPTPEPPSPTNYISQDVPAYEVPKFDNAKFRADLNADSERFTHNPAYAATPEQKLVNVQYARARAYGTEGYQESLMEDFNRAKEKYKDSPAQTVMAIRAIQKASDEAQGKLRKDQFDEDQLFQIDKILGIDDSILRNVLAEPALGFANGLVNYGQKLIGGAVKMGGNLVILSGRGLGTVDGGHDRWEEERKEYDSVHGQGAYAKKHPRPKPDKYIDTTDSAVANFTKGAP